MNYVFIIPGKMLTKDTWLPTEEELTVTEVRQIVRYLDSKLDYKVMLDSNIDIKLDCKLDSTIYRQ